MPLEPAWSLDELKASDLRGAAVWAAPSVRDRVAAALGVTPDAPGAPLPATAEVLVACGGGRVIDAAKAAAKRGPRLRTLVAVPSIWGSGAEASPVIVLDGPTGKEIDLAPGYRPDRRVVWPELAETVSEALARDACGDAWAHAVEAFVSPLADAQTRAELAALMNEMAALPIGRDARWFEPSAAACALQARAGVGLVHGIAHVLEAPLGRAHADLCATFLWPVWTVNRARSERWDELAGVHGVDTAAVEARLRELFDPTRCEAALPELAERWPAILRDPCTRTSAPVVRPAVLDDLLALA